jgi:hypothetical protein
MHSHGRFEFCTHGCIDGMLMISISCMVSRSIGTMRHAMAVHVLGQGVCEPLWPPLRRFPSDLSSVFSPLLLATLVYSSEAARPLMDTSRPRRLASCTTYRSTLPAREIIKQKAPGNEHLGLFCVNTSFTSAL